MAHNPYGDIELDATGMRALAHPLRLRLLGRLQRYGPSTATGLAEHVPASPSVVSWHLRHLAKHGLVRDCEPPVDGRRDGRRDGRERWWAAVARGVRYVAPPDDEGQIAYRALTRLMMDDAHQLPVIWANEIEPRLEPEWRALGGLANTTVLVTLDEAAQVEREFERILAPYVLRKDQETVPSGVRSVRLLRYALPDAETSDDPETSDDAENSDDPETSDGRREHPPLMVVAADGEAAPVRTRP